MASKYRNIKCTYNGLKFDSKAERERWIELEILEKVGEISNLKRQIKFPIEIGGKKICNYIADFTYTDKNGLYVVEDKKGVITGIYSIKKRLMKAVHGIEIKET